MSQAQDLSLLALSDDRYIAEQAQEELRKRAVQLSGIQANQQEVSV